VGETGAVSVGEAHWQADRRLALPSSSIGDILRDHGIRFGDRPALHWWDGAALRAMSYRELAAAANNVAGWLAQRCRPGERVALWAGNCVEWVLLQHGSGLAGSILTPFNTGWTDAEARHALELTSPTIAFVGNDHAGRALGERLAGLANCEVLPLAKVAEIAREPNYTALPDLTLASPYLIQFTSGTTGRAKGALLSQGAMLLGGWLRPRCEGADETDVWLNGLPYHHVGGTSTVILGALSLGASFVVMERFDREMIVELMAMLPPARMGGVPTMWADILNAPNLAGATRVKTITTGGASVPAELLKRVRERFGAHCAIGYGQSECPIISATMPGDPDWAICESIGRPLPHVELKIADPESGATLGIGQVGEIRVKGPTVMDGYWNDPAATAGAFDAQGYLCTGDLASMDAKGFCRFHGRSREVIIRGGENVYPAEIENILAEHPDVARAAAVPIEHPRLGHVVGAVIQLREGARADAEGLHDFLETRLARFKLPEHWRFVPAMPMTASGKVRKVDLAGMFAET
jgi:fatty-acyl-CoA synthase